jgi:predicted amidophosphoribosyltransferase
VLGGALARALADDPSYSDVEVVAHIPATRRGRVPDAACELAKAVARGLGVRCLPRLMARTRRTELQKDVVEWSEKRENVAGAFRVRRAELVRGKKVLLVDDVYDSGATLEEGWRVLMAAEAREVVVATVARTWY